MHWNNWNLNLEGPRPWRWRAKSFTNPKNMKICQSYMFLTSVVILTFIPSSCPYSTTTGRRANGAVTITQHQLREQDGYSSSYEDSTSATATSPKLSMQTPTLISDAVTDSTDYNLNFDYSNIGSSSNSNSNSNPDENVSGFGSSSFETTTSNGVSRRGHYSPGAGIRRTTFPAATNNNESNGIKTGARHFGNRIVQGQEVGVSVSSNSSISSSISNSIHQFASQPRQPQSQSVIGNFNDSADSDVNDTKIGGKRRKFNSSSSSTTLNYNYYPTSDPPSAPFSTVLRSSSSEAAAAATIATDPPLTSTSTTSRIASSSQHGIISPSVRRKQILMGIGLRTPRPTKYIVVNAEANTHGPTTIYEDIDEGTTPFAILTSTTSEPEPESAQLPHQSQSSQLLIKNRRVKIRLPTLPPTTTPTEPGPLPVADDEQDVPVSALPSMIEEKQELRPVLFQPSPAPSPAPSPKFEFNPSVTVKDGLYHYRYSDPEGASRVVHTQEFGVTRHSYGDDDDEDIEHDEYDSTTGSSGPAAPDPGNFQPISFDKVHLSGSEDWRSNESASFGSDLQPLTPIPLDVEEAPEHEQNFELEQEILIRPVKRNQDSLAVSATLTNQLQSSSEPGERAHVVVDHSHVAATPALPMITPTPSSSVTHLKFGNGEHHYDHDDNVFVRVDINETFNIYHDHHNNSSRSSDQENSEDQRNNNKILITPTFTDNVAKPPATNSKDFKTVSFSTTENPYFKSSSYSYTSSQEFSFYVPHNNDNGEGDDVDGEDQGISHNHHGQHHDHHENGNNSDQHDRHHHQQHHDHQTVEEDSLQKQQQIHPTTSTYSYWDTLGLKSVDPSSSTGSAGRVVVKKKNASSVLPQPSPLPTPESAPTTVSQLRPLSSPSPTIPGGGVDLTPLYSTPHAEIHRAQTSNHPETTPYSPAGSTSRSVVTIATTTTTGSSSNVNHVGVSEENEIVHGDDDQSGSAGGSNENVGDNPQQPHSNSADEAVQKQDEIDLVVNSNLNNIPMLLPVPVFVKIALQDVLPSMFCKNVEQFKEMIVTIYEKNHKSLSPAQIIVHNEPSCASPTRNISTTVSTPTTSTTTRRPYPTSRRVKVYTGESSEEQQNASKINQRKRRWALPADNLETPTKEDSKLPYPSSGETKRPSPSSTFYVYIYVTDKNGTYDRSLTESFITIWNVSGSELGSGEAGNGGGVGNMFSHKIKTVEMVTSTPQSVTGQGPLSENSGVIIAIAVASGVAACLLLAGVILLVMRHRQAQTKFAKRCTPVTLDDYSLDNISVFNSFRRKQRGRSSKRSYTNAGFEDANAPTRPLNAAGLLNAVTTESASVLSEEFSNIPNINPTLDDIPAGAETKNRYANVIPVPDTRVLLTFQDEQQNSDYINANFVRGANSTNKSYIITQGPLDETIVEFWRMVWEQQVRVIFMLTDLSESGIPKCAAYYPRSETIDCSQLHGDLQVTLEKRDIMENCITSYLVLKDMERSLRRDIIHCWYHTWPEKGVPAKPAITIDFLLKTRKFTKESYPVVVHCSPGTGRSGTIVACDIGMKELDGQKLVDIPQIVRKIRQDRAGAVQTKEQYKHIYEVLNSYATKISNNASSADNSRSDS